MRLFVVALFFFVSSVATAQVCSEYFEPNYNAPAEWSENLEIEMKRIEGLQAFEFQQNTLVNFALRVQTNGNDKAIEHKVGGRRGTWESMTWESYGDKVGRAAGKLKDLGMQPGDRVALISEARWEWAAIDLAVMANHGVSVGVGAELVYQD